MEFHSLLALNCSLIALTKLERKENKIINNKKNKLIKKHLLILAAFVSMLVSCSNDLMVENIDTDQKVENSDVTEFNLKIDSLNNVYSEMRNSNATRGYVSDYIIQTSADEVGRFVGSKVFSWAGSAIGVACSNPVIGICGYLAGRKYGGAATSAVASIGAAWLMNKWKTRATQISELTLNEDYVVRIKDPNNISDGELHNLIASKILKNIDKYRTSDGSLNFDLLLEDAYIYENEFAPFENYAEFKSLCLPKSIEQTKRIMNSVILSVNKDNEAFLDEVYKTLIPEIQVSRAEFDEANILNEKTLSTYTALDNDNVTKFSEDIDSLIEVSDLDKTLKAELKSSNSVLENSTLIWREVK